MKKISPRRTSIREKLSSMKKMRLAIAKEGELTIGTIDDIQKLHIRSIALGEHAAKGSNALKKNLEAQKSPQTHPLPHYPSSTRRCKQLLQSWSHKKYSLQQLTTLSFNPIISTTTSLS
ncbi:CPSF A subunit region domain-containing protein [Forsythia ovata]|uniref:CPSF A subunit region domain-containing protein n=1 Tax=Forsythia ovata TaxID=205694 RepID=A0ABD1PVX1_9LAMI